MPILWQCLAVAGLVVVSGAVAAAQVGERSPKVSKLDPATFSRQATVAQYDPDLALHSDQTLMLRLQVLLARARLSPGVIDGFEAPPAKRVVRDQWGCRYGVLAG